MRNSAAPAPRVHEIVVTPTALKCAEQVARDLQAAIGLAEPWTSLRAYFDAASRFEYVGLVERLFQIDLRELAILELGSGMGMFVTVARKLGLNCVGSEPCANSYAHLRRASHELCLANNIPLDALRPDPGESLPWPDQAFDVVLAFQVLEHVADPHRFLAEAVRVLRPGGRLFMDMPNHCALTEGHFGLLWGPPLAWSKSLARAYVRLCGKNPTFLSELNLVTPRRLRAWAAGLDAALEVSGPRRLVGPSPSTAGVEVRVKFPSHTAFPAGRRYGPVARRVRKLAAARGLRPAWDALGMSDHLWLVGRKHGEAASAAPAHPRRVA